MSGLGDMGNLLKQAQEMQRQVDRVRAELRARIVTGSSSAGDVRVEMTADRHEVRSVHVAPELLQGVDRGELEERIRSALGDGLRRSKEIEKEEIGRVTGGMQLPGLF
jgi:DNA-binding YbaB/EbfC family protein